MVSIRHEGKQHSFDVIMMSKFGNTCEENEVSDDERCEVSMSASIVFSSSLIWRGAR